MTRPLHPSWLAHRRPKLIPRVTFKAWRVGESGQAWSIDIGAPVDLDEAKANATVGSGLSHKETLLIHERGASGILRSYAVVKKAAIWRKNDQTGVPERFEPLALKDGFTMLIDRFDPQPPFNALTTPAALGRERN